MNGKYVNTFYLQIKLSHMERKQLFFFPFLIRVKCTFKAILYEIENKQTVRHWMFSLWTINKIPDCVFRGWCASTTNNILSASLLIVLFNVKSKPSCWDRVVMSTGLIFLRAESFSSLSLAWCSTAITKASWTLLFSASSSVVKENCEFHFLLE